MILTEIKECFTTPLSKTMTDEELYDYFLENIYSSNLKIYGMNIKTFTTPVEDNKMQGFFHLTTRTEKKFGLKMRFKEDRAYFINYIPIMINNYSKCATCENNKCSKIKIWSAPYKDKKRIKLLFTDKNKNSYIIIMEQKKNDIYIVTSYLIDNSNYLKKVLKEYNIYKKHPNNS